MVYFSIILTSSLLAALVSSVISYNSNERKLQIENVTQERAKWRVKVRELAIALHDAKCSNDKYKLGQLVTQFQTNLNPFHDEDKAIIKAIYSLSTNTDNDLLFQEVVMRLSLLLKYEWEKAKYESLPWYLKRLRSEKERTTYEQYLAHSERSESTIDTPKGKGVWFWNFLWTKYFGLLLLSGGFLFIFTACLKEPFSTLVNGINTTSEKVTMEVWWFGILMALTFGSLWGIAWVTFKYAEKKCVELHGKSAFNFTHHKE